MLEIHIMGGGRPRLPWPGPGSHIVDHGSLKDGYAGTVAVENLPPAYAITEPLGGSATAYYPFSTWGKFVVGNKVLFIPDVQITLTQNKSFVDVWNAEMAYRHYDGIPEHNEEPLPGLNPVSQGFEISHIDTEGKRWDYCVRLITDEEARTIFRHIYKVGDGIHHLWAPQLARHAATAMMTSTLEEDKVIFRQVAKWNEDGILTGIGVVGTPFLILELLDRSNHLYAPGEMRFTTLGQLPETNFDSGYLNKPRYMNTYIDGPQPSALQDKTAPLSKSRYSRISTVGGFVNDIKFSTE